MPPSLQRERKGCLRNRDTEGDIKLNTWLFLTSCHQSATLRPVGTEMHLWGHHRTRENCRFCRIQLHWRAASIRNHSKQEDTPEIPKKKKMFTRRKYPHTIHIKLSSAFWGWKVPPTWNQDRISSPSRKGNNQELSRHFAAVTKLTGTQLSMKLPGVWARGESWDKQRV